jgi:hypothetical protein
MRRELKDSTENNKPRSDAFASVVRSFGEANSRFQALAVESVGRAVEIQSQFVGKAYDIYISELSKLGRMFVVGYRTFTARSQALPYANLNETAIRQQGALAEAKVNPDPARPRTAAQSMITKRKTGTVGKSQSGSKRSSKAKRKIGSVRRGKN